MTDLNAAQWNRYHPIGTPVMAYPGVRPEFAATIGLTPYDPDCGRPIGANEYRWLETVTRSVAWHLGRSNGEPVVMVDGYAGGISLEHIDPIGVDQ